MENSRLGIKKCGEERRIVSNKEWQISKEKMWWSKNVVRKKCEKRMADQEFKKCGKERFQKVKKEWYISNKKMK